MRVSIFTATVMVGLAAWCQTPPQPALTAEEIMAQVAANQDRSEKLRTQYVYTQRVRISSRRSNGKLMREETHEYHVVPAADGTAKQLKGVNGRYWYKGRYLEFKGEPVPESGSLDGSLVEDFRDEVANDKSKDGISRDLFPLTTEQQKKYRFKLLGEQQYQRRTVYRVGFAPRDTRDLTWAGEAYIDQKEFQPMLVFTKLSRRIPFWVRTFLGTDVPGLGFSVQYRRQPDGVWFPTSLGTEFRLRAVFFLKRDLFVSLENSDFEHTHVDTKIELPGLLPPP